MPFQKGQKFSPGGKKGNKGGRLTKAQAEAKIIGKQYIKRWLERDAAKALRAAFTNLAASAF